MLIIGFSFLLEFLIKENWLINDYLLVISVCVEMLSSSKGDSSSFSKEILNLEIFFGKQIVFFVQKEDANHRFTKVSYFYQFSKSKSAF